VRAGRIELATTVASLEELRASDIGPYDLIYLGSPYCERYAGNFLACPGDLAAAVDWLRDRGARACLTTYAAPRLRHLDPLRRALEAAARAGVAGVEVHGPGLARLVRDEFPALALHVGSFANVYTVAGARLYAGFGAARLAPPTELPLDEVAALAREGGLPVEVPVHGKLPLGVSESCLLLDCAAAWGTGCPDLCRQDVFLRRDEWVLKSVGTGVLTGRDLCLLPALPRLVADGHRHFRVEALSEAPAYRAAAGAVYRAALEGVLAGDGGADPAWMAALARHSRAGFCNGFAYGRSGLEHVDAAAGPGGSRG
jgi:putative protease